MNENDEWIENGLDSGYLVGFCKCGQLGIWKTNPYDREIYEEHNYSFFCWDCYSELCDGI